MKSNHINRQEFQAAPDEEPPKNTKQEDESDSSRFHSIVVGLLGFSAQPASNAPARKGRTWLKTTDNRGLSTRLARFNAKGCLFSSVADRRGARAV